MLHSINFLSWRETHREAHKKRFLYLTVISISIVVSMQWGVGWYFDKQTQIQTQRLSFLNQHLLQLDKQIDSLKRAEQEYNDLVARLAMVESLQKKRNKTTQFMDLVPKLIPEGVYVDQMSMNDQLIEISGISDSTARLATMLQLLESSPLISNVEMHSIVSGSHRFGKQFQSFKVSFLFHMQADELPQTEGVS